MWRPCLGWRGGRRCSMLLRVPPSEMAGSLVLRLNSTIAWSAFQSDALIRMYTPAKEV